MTTLTRPEIRTTFASMIRKLALRRLADLRAGHAEYVAECESDARNGHRSYYCEHGMNLWVEWDPICGYCEDGHTYEWGTAIYRDALDWAIERVIEFHADMETVNALRAMARRLPADVFSVNIDALFIHHADTMRGAEPFRPNLP